jgi:hypothetical protein
MSLRIEITNGVMFGPGYSGVNGYCDSCACNTASSLDMNYLQYTSHGLMIVKFTWTCMPEVLELAGIIITWKEY